MRKHDTMKGVMILDMEDLESVSRGGMGGGSCEGGAEDTKTVVCPKCQNPFKVGKYKTFAYCPTPDCPNHKNLFYFD